MLIDRQLGDGTIFKRRAAEQKEEEVEERDQMERHGSFTESAREHADNNNGGKPRHAHQETPAGRQRGGATPRDEHSTTEILSGSYLAVQ